MKPKHPASSSGLMLSDLTLHINSVSALFDQLADENGTIKINGIIRNPNTLIMVFNYLRRINSRYTFKCLIWICKFMFLFVINLLPYMFKGEYRSEYEAFKRARVCACERERECVSACVRVCVCACSCSCVRACSSVFD